MNFINNNRGVSLLEVLVAVSIIGIIAAIAVPAFNDYRETAAVTAVDATATNLAKAYNLCTATSSGSCATLTDLKISCSNCNPPKPYNSTNGFCVDMETKVSNQEFKACVQIKPDGTVLKKYGGDFKFCYGTSPLGADNVAGNDDADEYAKGLRKCSVAGDCTQYDESGGTNDWTSNSCKGRNAGGACSAAAVCS